MAAFAGYFLTRVTEAAQPWAARPSGGRLHMLFWAATFLIAALVAAYPGFAFLAGLAGEIAKVVFGLFLFLFVLSLFTGRRRPVF